MKNILYSFFWILIPFLGTGIGSALVFFIKKDIKMSFQKIFNGFASGIMIVASIWSLILPSMEMANEQSIVLWMPAIIGFGGGIFFLIIINKTANRLSKLKNFDMLMFSVTLHNIPEGMVVGVGLAGFLSEIAGLGLNDAIMIAISIAIQNIPDGAIVSLPLKMKGYSSKKSFWLGVISGAVEPIAAVLTIVLSNMIIPVLPYLLSFSAGAMFYVVIQELIPNMNHGKKDSLGIFGFTIGFAIMLILEISLG